MPADDTIGVIPAAGSASRLWRLPGAKELLPVGYDLVEIAGTPRQIPKVISSFLMDQLRRARVKKAIMILTDQKLDLIRYYGSGGASGLDLGFLVVDDTASMPHSIARAASWCKDRRVVFGMPDTMFTPPDAARDLLRFHTQRQADLSLGLFPTEEPWRFGMVDVSEGGHILQCVDKPEETDLKWLWGFACWEPVFFDLLQGKVATSSGGGGDELVLGDIFQLAIEEGLNVQGLPFETGEYHDIGTPESYAKAMDALHFGSSKSLRPPE